MAMEITDMTVKQLRDALAQLGAGHDNKKVVIWLPGSRIDLNTSLFLREGEIHVEGNLREGSALCS
jgi:hypothetical protein